MTEQDAELFAKLLTEKKIVNVVRLPESVEITFDDRSVVTIHQARGFIHPDSSLDERNLSKNLSGAEHLTDPFSRPEEASEKEGASTPACLGGNECHPSAPEMFPGPGV